MVSKRKSLGGRFQLFSVRAKSSAASSKRASSQALLPRNPFATSIAQSRHSRLRCRLQSVGGLLVSERKFDVFVGELQYFGSHALSGRMFNLFTFAFLLDFAMSKEKMAGN